VERMRVYGHGPEDGSGPMFNTLPSFPWCRDQGADGVELDVRCTSDDQVVVVHDWQLGHRAVSETPREELPPEVPDLADVLDVCRGMTVIGEVKNFPQDPGWDPSQRLAHLVVDLLAERGGTDDVVVSCFGLDALNVVRERAPATPTAALLLHRRPLAELLAPIAAAGHALVHPYDAMVDTAFVDAAREHGLGVDVWMLEVPAARFAELAALGVRGVITPQIAEARAGAAAALP
jgi:glycerophosphoryl diester phosphodiesterase